ncbi:MAG TPA: hypothetical protein VF331_22795 [Polyangiales bacterium]
MAQPIVIPDRDDFAKTDVLVEYDGPQLALFSSRKDILRLGTAISSDDDGSHWLVAPVTKVEMEAMARSKIPMRAAFEKEMLSTVVFDSKGKAKRLWKTSDEDLPDGILPVRGAPLPRGAREFLLEKFAPSKKVAPRRVRFDGRRIIESTIEFSALSRVVGTLQGVWTAIAETLGLPTIADGTAFSPSALVANASLGRGSVAVTLHPADDGVFNAILAKYEELMQFAYREDASAFSAHVDGDNLRKQLREYMGALSDLELDTFFETPTAHVYTGYSRARVVRASLRGQIAPPTTTEEKPAKREQITKKGHFDGVKIGDKTFVFVDLDTGHEMSGKIATPLANRLNQDGVLVGGSSVFYKAVFSKNSKGTTLLSFEKLQGDLF